MKAKIKNRQQGGFAVLVITFFALIIMLSIALAMGFVIVFRQQSSTDMVKSAQAYYAAEAGIEDALLRLKKTPQISSLTYNLSVDNTTVEVSIPVTIGVSKQIISRADNGGIQKAIRTVSSIDNSQNVSFYYGIQAGRGGFVMKNESRVKGSVFSSGNISGGSGIIENDVVVSGNNSIAAVRVEGNALAYSCLSPATVVGNLTYVSGGIKTCTVQGDTLVRYEEIEEQPLPIPEWQIDRWKERAADTEIFYGNMSIDGNEIVKSGPVKITGNLTININATLMLTGTVYVVGNINIDNNVTVKLDSSYAASGGVMIADGDITVGNEVIFSGSGQTGSYLLILSTSSSDDAIRISNNATGVVFYTANGAINISNDVKVTEATGYKIIMNNNSIVEYSSGMINIYFSSGPGGGWKVSSWQEQ